VGLVATVLGLVRHRPRGRTHHRQREVSRIPERREIDQHFTNRSVETNLPVLMGARSWNRTFLGCHAAVLPSTSAWRGCRRICSNWRWRATQERVAPGA